MKKKLAAGLLCLCLTIALLPATVLADQADLNWTEFVTGMPDSGYLEDAAGNVSISTAAGLAWLASLVNGLNGQTADDFSGRTISLTAAIDLAGHDWIPIGQVTKAFAGSFDGKSKSISNMSVNLSPDESGDAVYAGLFGVPAQASLQNIILDGTAAISGDAGKNYAGGIVAYLAGGSVTNSDSSVDVSIAAGSNQENYAGGIAGGNNSGLIKNSSAYEQISATGKNSWNYAGGIVGKNDSGRVEACTTAVGSVAAGGNSSMNKAGGISGVNSGHLAACANFSSVEAAGDDLSLNYAGGLAGVNYGEISRSFNGNTVSALGTDAYNAAGGIAGRNYEAATVTACSNQDSVAATGDRTGNYPAEEFCNDAGGLAGSNLGLLINSFNEGSVTATGAGSENDAGGLAGYNVDGAIVANSYNTAPVAATGQTLNRAGGLVGANENAPLANSYNTGPVSANGGDNFTGGAAGTNERGIVANSYWLETTATRGLGQGSASSCAGFSQAQGKGLETTPAFKYTIGTEPERTGSLVMALNAWVKKPSLAATSYSYQTWTNVEDDKPGYPVFGTPAPGEAAADLPDQPGETLPLPTDPDLPQTGASTSKPLVPILVILAGLSSLSLIYYRKKTHA